MENIFFNKRLHQQQKLQRLQESIKKQRQITEFKRKNKPFLLKYRYNSIIPLKIYTCWHTKDLPECMNKNVEHLKSSNPKFEVLRYDEDMCREFIQNNFSNDVLDAYNKLKPCSYKSDLWRFCVLYKNGGIYVDIKYRCINNFKFIALTEQEHFVRDRESYGGTYTALIVTLPQNQIMWNCIQKIVENVKNQYYGDSSLDPTGPGLLGTFSTKDEKAKMGLHFESTIIENVNNNNEMFYIMFRNSIILTPYKQYRDEQKRTQKFEPYDALWNKKDIYYT